MTISSITTPRATTPTQLLILVNLIAGFALFVFGDPIYRSFLPSKREMFARCSVRELARRYPAWVAQHPGACPRIEDLDALGPREGTVDLWGNEYVVRCDGAITAVISRGADGELGTDDDIRAMAPRT